MEARVCKHARPLPVSGCALRAVQSEVPSSRAGPTSAAGRLTGCHVQGAGPLGAGPKPPFRLVLRFNFQVMAVPDPAEAAGARAKKSCGWATHPSGSVPTGPALGPGPWPRRRATRRTPGPSLAASILQPQAAGLHVHCPGLSMPRATAPLHAAASASASMLLPARAPRVDWHGEGCFVRRPPKPALASWPLQCSGLL